MKRSNFPFRKEQRRTQAAERQAAYDALSNDEKVARAVPGSRQHKRLTGGK